MYYNQMQQVQQKVNSVQQMVSNIRQSEQNNHQKLQQIAQDEAYAAQQLQRVQQICQEVVSNLQNISTVQPFTGAGTAQGYVSPTELAHFGATQPGTYGTSPVTQGYQGTTLFDPTTMGAGTYQGTMQTFGNMPLSGMQAGYIPHNAQAGMMGSSMMPTSSNLSNIATMGPDTYQASREQFGKAGANLGQIGQQAGISGYGTTGTVGMTTGSPAGNIGGGITSGSQFSNIATMSPDTYQSAQQRFGGTSSNLSQIGQQAGITGGQIQRGYNQ